MVINYLTDAKSADDLIKHIGADRALAVQADVSTVGGCEKLVNAVVEKFGRIDVLIPNAGVLPMKDLEHTTEADFDATFALNVKGPYFLTQVCTLSCFPLVCSNAFHRKLCRTCPAAPA